MKILPIAWITALAVAIAAPAGAQSRLDAAARAARKALPAKRGTVIVLDAASGKLLYTSDPAIAAWRLAAPGSTVKPFVIHALLEQGKLRPDERIACPRKLAIAGHQLNCTHPELPGPLDPVQAIAYSCNTYVTTVGARFAPTELLDVFRKIGFASPTTLMSDEATGRLSRATNNDQLRLQAIGEYGMHVTPLELAVAYGNLAQRLHGSTAMADVEVRLGLEQAVEYGMAHAVAVDEVKVAGKTGTSLMDNAAATHGWFAGYAPADGPQIVVVVYLEQGRGTDAAEIAAKVLRAYFGASK